MTLVQLLHAEVMRQQLFQRQALLGGVSSFHQGRHVGACRRPVDITDCLLQGHHAQLATQVRRQEFFKFQDFLLKQGQCLVAQLEPARLPQAIHRWVDRCEPVRDGFVLLTEDSLVAGVYHFQPLEPGTYFPVATQPRPAGKLLFLCSPEMEKAQGDASGAVGYNDHQHGPARPDDSRVFHAAFNLYPGPGIQAAHGMNACPVFVA